MGFHNVDCRSDVRDTVHVASHQAFHRITAPVVLWRAAAAAPARSRSTPDPTSARALPAIVHRQDIIFSQVEVHAHDTIAQVSGLTVAVSEPEREHGRPRDVAIR